MMRIGYKRVCLLIVVMVVGAAGCSERNEKGKSASAPPPPVQEVSLSAGLRERLAVPERTGGDECQILCDTQGRRWVVVAGFRKSEYIVRTTKGWEQSRDLTPSRWKFLKELRVIEDSQGNPFVVAVWIKEGVGQVVSAIHWKDRQWAEPVLLDHPNGPVSSLDAAKHADGHIHVVYNRPLVPREKYSIGMVMVDGEFPNKCFHVFFDGNRWSRSCPTTGRGRYYVESLRLGTSPEGDLTMSYCASPFSQLGHENVYIARQIWGRARWTEPTSVNPEEHGIAGRVWSGFIVIDGWGNEHLWAGSERNQYCMLNAPKTAKADGPVGVMGIVVKRLPDGKIAAMARGKLSVLSVWNGATWSQPLTMDGEDYWDWDFCVNPAGGLVAWVWNNTELTIQEITITEK